MQVIYAELVKSNIWRALTHIPKAINPAPFARLRVLLALLVSSVFCAPVLSVHNFAVAQQKPAIAKQKTALKQLAPDLVKQLNKNFYCVLNQGEYSLARNRTPSLAKNRLTLGNLRLISQEQLEKIELRIPKLRARARKAPSAKLQATLRGLKKTLQSAKRCDALQPPVPTLPCLPQSGILRKALRGSTLEVNMTQCLTENNLSIAAVSQTASSAIITADKYSVRFHPDISLADGEYKAKLKICDKSPNNNGFLQRCINDYQILFKSCNITLPTQTHSITQGTLNSIPLNAVNTCGNSTQFELVEVGGSIDAVIVDNNLALQIPWNVPAETVITVRPCDAVLGCDKDQVLFLKLASVPESSAPPESSEPSEFSGNPNSLDPYRQEITQSERNHLVRRLAYGHPSYLRGPDGHTLLLDQLLEDRLLNRDWFPEDTKAMLEKYRDTGAKFTKPINNDQLVTVVETGISANTHTLLFLPDETFDTPEELRDGLRRLYAVSGRGYNTITKKFSSKSRDTTAQLLFYVRYGSASEAFLAHLLLGSFGVAGNTTSGHQERFIWQYFYLILNNALGNFKQLILGESTDNTGNYDPLSGFLGAALPNLFLDNNFNEKPSNNDPGLNENYARELMELFLLGPKDHVTGLSNYDQESDVNSAASFTTGYHRFNSDHSGFTWLASKFDQTPRSLFNQLGPYYPDLPIVNKSMKSHQFVEHLFAHHPALPRFVARRLFAMIVHPNPSDELVEELGFRFKELDYDLYEFTKMIVRSEAMFSEQALHRSCIKEPFRAWAQTISILQLPMVRYAGQQGNGGNARFTMMYSLHKELSMALNAAGEQVMNYPDVFSYDYCGRNPHVDGRAQWMDSSKLLGRVNGSVKLLERLDNRLEDDFDLLGIRGLILENPYTQESLSSISDITPDHVINFFVTAFGLTLDNNERTVLGNYLTTSSTGAFTEFNAANDIQFQHKIAGLIAIITTLAQANVG